jgi:TolB-like protein
MVSSRLEDGSDETAPSAGPAAARLPASGTPNRRRARLSPLIVGSVLGVLALLALAGYLARARQPALDARRIAVAVFENRTGDRTLDPVGVMAADWVARGLNRTGVIDAIDIRTALRAARADSAQPAGIGDVMRLARETGARSVVWGSYYLERDSLRISAQILDARDGHVVRALTPVAAPADHAIDAVEQLLQKVMGAIAALGDPRLQASATSATELPGYEAYTEYIAGIELAVRSKGEEAYPHLVRAAQLDSSFVQALLLAAEFRESAADSILALVAPRRSRLSPYDQANLDRLVAYRAGRWDEVLDAARRMARLASGSQDANYIHGWAALANNRFHEAADAFARVGTSPGWMRDWGFNWRWPLLAHHLRGAYDEELAAARAERGRFPADPDLCMMVPRALAGLRRAAEVPAPMRECVALRAEADRSVTFREVARELDHHGNSDLARQYFDSALALLRVRAQRDSGYQPELANVLYLAGRWEEGLPLLRREAARWLGVQTLGRLGVAAARLGDRALADSVARGIAALADAPLRQRLLWQGRIAAGLGERKRAVALLRRAVAEGAVPAFVMHPDRALEGLRGYPPFEELMRPRDPARSAVTAQARLARGGGVGASADGPVRRLSR